MAVRFTITIKSAALNGDLVFLVVRTMLFIGTLTLIKVGIRLPDDLLGIIVAFFNEIKG